jgi:hypothetical protein
MTDAEIDEFMDDAIAKLGRNPWRCEGSACRSGFALRYMPKNAAENAQSAGFHGYLVGNELKN